MQLLEFSQPDFQIAQVVKSNLLNGNPRTCPGDIVSSDSKAIGFDSLGCRNITTATCATGFSAEVKAIGNCFTKSPTSVDRST